MKTIKELKDGDIVWFVTGTIIKETIVKNFHIEDLSVIDGLGEGKWKEIDKPHYIFETWLDGKLQFSWNFEIEEYKDQADTAYIYDGEKDYRYWCTFLNKKDAIKYLKKNIKAEIRHKQKMIKHINEDIESLENQLNSL